jgi:hypothetical protein
MYLQSLLQNPLLTKTYTSGNESLNIIPKKVMVSGLNPEQKVQIKKKSSF